MCARDLVEHLLSLVDEDNDHDIKQRLFAYYNYTPESKLTPEEIIDALINASLNLSQGFKTSRFLSRQQFF